MAGSLCFFFILKKAGNGQEEGEFQ